MIPIKYIQNMIVAAMFNPPYCVLTVIKYYGLIIYNSTADLTELSGDIGMLYGLIIIYYFESKMILLNFTYVK